jgi:hypothetical protein
MLAVPAGVRVAALGGMATAAKNAMAAAESAAGARGSAATALAHTEAAPAGVAAFARGALASPAIMLVAARGMAASARGAQPRARRRRRAGIMAESGEGFIDVLVKMLIVVVVGAVLLSIMRTAVPQLFSDMIDKIRSVFEL